MNVKSIFIKCFEKFYIFSMNDARRVVQVIVIRSLYNVPIFCEHTNC